MNDYQLVLLAISLALFISFFILSFVRSDKSGEWVSWYGRLSISEKKKYNPLIALRRMKKVLLITSITGIIGFVLSIHIDERLAIATLIILLSIFILQIQYTGPKSSLNKEEK